MGRICPRAIAAIGNRTDSCYVTPMRTIPDTIRDELTRVFIPTALQVIDDSSRHAGHAGARPEGNTHFTVKIVSDAFTGMSPVARHRAVYAALLPLFDTGLHALAIEAKTPAEL